MILNLITDQNKSIKAIFQTIQLKQTYNKMISMIYQILMAMVMIILILINHPLLKKCILELISQRVNKTKKKKKSNHK